MVAQDYFAQKDQWLAEKKDLEDAVFCLKIAVSGQCVFQFCKQLHVEGHKQLTSNSTLEIFEKGSYRFQMSKRCTCVRFVRRLARGHRKTWSCQYHCGLLFSRCFNSDTSHIRTVEILACQERLQVQSNLLMVSWLQARVLQREKDLTTSVTATDVWEFTKIQGRSEVFFWILWHENSIQSQPCKMVTSMI